MFILLISFSAGAQELVITDTIFLDADWNVTQNRADATYYRGVWPNSADSTLLVHDFYLETFTIQMIGVYKNKVKPMNQIGEFRYFYKNGNLRALYNYKNGIMNGSSTLFYENGNKEIVRKFKNGKLTDTLYYYTMDGNPKEIRLINPDYDSENSAEAEKEYKLIAFWNNEHVKTIDNGTGIKTEYYENGNKRYSIEYVDGFPHGEWIQYNENKKIISKMTFKHGKFISGLMYPKRKKDIFASLYREPRFPGGVKALDDFVSKNTDKCRDSIPQEITLIIHISEEGDAEYDQIITGDINNCQYEELVELVKKMPKWTPAVRYGRYVESSYVLRVKY